VSTNVPEGLQPFVDPMQRFPRTRYQGSKRKLAAATLRCLGDLEYDTVLDAFGGTGAVAYAFKCAAKAVTYNDVLAFNHQIGTALIENSRTALDEETARSIGRRLEGVVYPSLVEDTFEGVYFTPEENRWLDVAATNIARIECRYRRAIAWFALCQAAMAKRPYNLFHRRNLYMRTADVKRGFGNKTTWERSFDSHFLAAVAEANEAIVDLGRPCRAVCGDALDVKGTFDLVYVDTPYVRKGGVGVDYRDFYHFLEGLLHYDRWADMIDRGSRHLRLTREPNPWCVGARCGGQFRRLFGRYRGSILVVSYRSDGVPSIEELAAWLGDVKRSVRVIDSNRYQYVLSKNRSSREVLLIGSD